MWAEDFVFEKGCRGHCKVRSEDWSWSACIEFKHDNFASLVGFLYENPRRLWGCCVEFFDLDLLKYMTEVQENLSGFSVSFVFNKRSSFPIYLYPHLLAGFQKCRLFFDDIEFSPKELWTLGDWQLCDRKNRFVLIRDKLFGVQFKDMTTSFFQVAGSDSEVKKYVETLLDLLITNTYATPLLELRMKNEAFSYVDHLLASSKSISWSVKTNSSCLRSVQLLSETYDQTSSVILIGEETFGTRLSRLTQLPENQKSIIFTHSDEFEKRSGIPRRLGKALGLFKFPLLKLQIHYADYAGFIENLNNLVRAKCVPQLLSLDIKQRNSGSFEEHVTKSTKKAYLSLVLQIFAECKDCTKILISNSRRPGSVELPSPFFSLLYDLDHIKDLQIFARMPDLKAKSQRMGESDTTARYIHSGFFFGRFP